MRGNKNRNKQEQRTNDTQHDEINDKNKTSTKTDCLVYADLHSFPSPSLITGGSLRPDLALISPDKSLYALEFTGWI